MQFEEQIRANRQALIDDVFRRLEIEAQPFADALECFLGDLFAAVLPLDWRQRWHTFVAEQAELGFFVEPESIVEMEEWIEAWAKYCKLWPAAESPLAFAAAEPDESGLSNSALPGSKLDKAEMLTYFEILYGKKGKKLRAAFEASGGLIKVESLWFGARSALDTRSAGRPQQIRVSEALGPAEAAQELMERLIDATALTEVRQRLDHSGFDNIETIVESYRQSVKQAAQTVAFASELYFSGISIASEGADWIVTLHDLSQGNCYAAIGLLPLLPAAIGKTGYVLKHGAKKLRIPAESIQSVRTLPIDELIALLESTGRLARNMEKAGIKRPPETAAHHIVPAALKKYQVADKARKILKRFEIGVDNAANGVYLPSKFDDAVKAAYHQTLHSKKYFDEVYERLRELKSKEEVLTALDKIRRELLLGTFPH